MALAESPRPGRHRVKDQKPLRMVQELPPQLSTPLATQPGDRGPTLEGRASSTIHRKRALHRRGQENSHSVRERGQRGNGELQMGRTKTE